MTWNTSGREKLKIIDDVNDFRSWTQGSTCYKHLLDVIEMNDFTSWAQGSRCYEQLKDVDEMNDFES